MFLHDNFRYFLYLYIFAFLSKCVDNDRAFGALFTDISKAFDFLSHELLFAKLDAYGFDKNALKLVNSYLSNRKQRVKINGNYCLELNYGNYCLGFHKVQSYGFYCSTFHI